MKTDKHLHTTIMDIISAAPADPRDSQSIDAMWLLREIINTYIEKGLIAADYDPLLSRIAELEAKLGEAQEALTGADIGLQSVLPFIAKKEAVPEWDAMVAETAARHVAEVLAKLVSAAIDAAMGDE